MIYLIYNAGVARPDEPLLCAEAIRLARILSALMPDEPEVAGLLALLLLTESRRPARLRADGSLAVLAEQDRALWDRALIDEGQTIVRRCLRRNQPGPYPGVEMSVPARVTARVGSEAEPRPGPLHI